MLAVLTLHSFISMTFVWEGYVQELGSKLHMQTRQTLIKTLIINQRLLEYDVF